MSGTGNTKDRRHCTCPRGTLTIYKRKMAIDEVAGLGNRLKSMSGSLERNILITGWELTMLVTLGKEGSNRTTLQKRI